MRSSTQPTLVAMEAIPQAMASFNALGCCSLSLDKIKISNRFKKVGISSILPGINTFFSIPRSLASFSRASLWFPSPAIHISKQKPFWAILLHALKIKEWFFTLLRLPTDPMTRRSFFCTGLGKNFSVSTPLGMIWVFFSGHPQKCWNLRRPGAWKKISNRPDVRPDRRICQD